MKVYIVGAGAVGTYVGRLLERMGSQVEYAPRELHDVKAVQADVAIAAVKAYDTDGAIETLRHAIEDATNCVFVSPQNGVGNEEKLAHAFGEANVVACALTVPVDRGRNGETTAAEKGGIAFAPLGAKAHNWLWAAFGNSGLTVKVVSDWRALKWSKLCLNIVANASCAILNVLPNRLVHYEQVFTLELQAIREVRAVMQAMALAPVDLPHYPVRVLQGVATLPGPLARTLLGNRIAGARGRKLPSLLQDLRAGKEFSEVNVLNGAVAAAGLRYGVATPVNAVFARVLEDIAQMPQLWAKYRERPETLEAEVQAEVRRTRALTKG